MTDHKFTDDDVIETLKNAKYKVDGVVTRGFYLSPETFNAVVDLIGRQEAEIDDLKVELDAMRGAANSYKMHYEEAERKYKIAVAEREANVEGFIETLKTIKAEAIKEFAWRLKSRLTPYPEAPFCERVSSLDIDALVEEMTEEQNESQNT